MKRKQIFEIAVFVLVCHISIFSASMSIYEYLQYKEVDYLISGIGFYTVYFVSAWIIRYLLMQKPR